MKMLKLLAFLGMVTFAGCDVQAQSERLATHDHNRIREVCFSGYQRGGITPKINAEHYPYTCSQAIN